MTKILVQKLIAYFERMLREHWAYKWGAAQTGCVDCAGAFVWAYRQEGESIYHGSNRIARQSVAELLPVDKARPGMAAFKLRPPDAKGYALPGTYKKGGKNYNGDLNDYYHIGLVAEDGKTVLNAQSAKTGFVLSQLSQNWACVGYLKKVEYEQQGEEEKRNSATVFAQSGSYVKMRAEPSTRCRLWWRVPIGSEVEIIAEGTDWLKIKHAGKAGYMQAQFLSRG